MVTDTHRLTRTGPCRPDNALAPQDRPLVSRGGARGRERLSNILRLNKLLHLPPPQPLSFILTFSLHLSLPHTLSFSVSVSHSLLHTHSHIHPPPPPCPPVAPVWADGVGLSGQTPPCSPGVQPGSLEEWSC